MLQMTGKKKREKQRETERKDLLKSYNIRNATEK